MIRGENIDQDFRNLIFDFFYWFSRFEYALKERRYLISHVVGQKVEPSWREFWEAHEGNYIPSSSARTLLDAKPKRQIVGETEHEFQDQPIPHGASDLQRLATYVRTVRNNLFHGGKHGMTYWDNPDRVRLLLTATIIVLGELAEVGGFGGDYDLYY